MIVRKATDGDILAVFQAVAAERASELCATAWHESPRQLAEELAAVRYARPSLLFVHCEEGSPGLALCIIGVVPFGPSLGGMIWVARPYWPAIALPSHRWWRTYFVPEVLQKQYRRVEFTALAADKTSRRWLKVLGFTEEGIAYRQGKRGEDFVHCAWLNPDPAVGVQSHV